jgi:kynurenine formamidase
MDESSNLPIDTFETQKNTARDPDRREEIGCPYIDNKNVHRHAKVAAVCVTIDGHRSAAFSLLVIVQDRELHTVFLRQSVPIVENGRHHACKRVGLLRRNVA